MKVIFSVLLAALSLTVQAQQADLWHSFYTPIGFDVCLEYPNVLPEDEGEPYGQLECPSLLGYRTLLSWGDARSTLRFQKGDLMFDFWSFAHEVGAFPIVSGDLLEWRFWGEEFKGLIYRVDGSDIDDVSISYSRLLVLAAWEGGLCTAGIVDTNEESRLLLEDYYCGN